MYPWIPWEVAADLKRFTEPTLGTTALVDTFEKTDRKKAQRGQHQHLKTSGCSCPKTYNYSGTNFHTANIITSFPACRNLHTILTLNYFPPPVCQVQILKGGYTAKYPLFYLLTLSNATFFTSLFQNTRCLAYIPLLGVLRVCP